MSNSPLREKSYNFAIDIVEISKYLQSERKEFILSKQLLRSGTSIGALVRESEFAQSKLDFINKLSVALKEANETDYWLQILTDTNYLDKVVYEKNKTKCSELISLLVKSIKTAKSNLEGRMSRQGRS